MWQGWRWVFYISAMGGLPVALLLLFTVKEEKAALPPTQSDVNEESPLISDRKTDTPPTL